MREKDQEKEENQEREEKDQEKEENQERGGKDQEKGRENNFVSLDHKETNVSFLFFVYNSFFQLKY